MPILESETASQSDWQNALKEIDKVYKEGDYDVVTSIMDTLTVTSTLYDLNQALKKVLIKLRAARMMGY